MSEEQNGWNFFGFEIRRRPVPDSQKSFTPPQTDDGAVTVAAGGSYGTVVDLDGTVKSEAELVSKYRQMSQQSEIDRAINEVVNDAIVNEDGKETVQIILDEVPIEDNLKNIITQEFKGICELLDFQASSYDVFKRWYIDGRSYYHVVIDEQKPQEGIKELRYIDPKKIRKVREVLRKTDPISQATIQKTKQEYYVYNERGFNNSARIASAMGQSGIKIKLDSVLHVTSGLLNEDNSLVLSYLHPAIKPLNQLRALEDATLIYHLSRAPERRIFYIDVGNLPKIKAEQYLREMMVKHKNKLSYDASTGEIRDDRKFMTMLEDYWLPRREGNRGTEISVLQGGTQLSQLLESIEYFQDRLYRSLQVPISRLKPDTVYTLGRATEISRDEVNFSKFIDRLRDKFSQIFLKALEKQLILKGIATPDDWEIIKKHIRFHYLRDNYITELKEMDILAGRYEKLNMVTPFAGKYVSHTYIRKMILKQTDEEIQEIDFEIQEEMQNPQYNMEFMMQQAELQQTQTETKNIAKKK